MLYNIIAISKMNSTANSIASSILLLSAIAMHQISNYNGLPTNPQSPTSDAPTSHDCTNA